MVAFRTPDFVSTCNIWLFPNNPSIGAADLLGFPCQMYYNARDAFGLGNLFTAIRFPLSVMGPFPKFQPNPSGAGDVLELEAGSGIYYKIFALDTVHQGFPNAYAEAIASPIDATLTLGVPCRQYP